MRYLTENTREVSAHFVVNGEGDITAMVPLNKSAHHAGAHNPYSHGIELSMPVLDRPYQDGHYHGLIACIRMINQWQRAQGYGEIPYVRRMSAFGSAGLITHADTEQGRNQGNKDPGPMFDWDKLLGMLVD